MNPWIQTVSGVAFDLLAPTVEMVRVPDIAHALSRVNRFNGHTVGEPYSVAHHSMLVADLLASWGCPPEIVREGLLHDAPEAYYGDVTSPMKRALEELGTGGKSVRVKDGGDVAAYHVFAGFEALTKPIDRIVREALSLPEHESPIVKRADLVALAIERRDLFDAPEPRDWLLPEWAPSSAPCDRAHGIGSLGNGWVRLTPAHLSPWSTASARFVALLTELDGQVSR